MTLRTVSLLPLCLLAALLARGADSVPSGPSATGASVSAVTLPPTPPLPNSPVSQFRQWLALAPDQRAGALASRPEKQREFLQQRLAEYEGLNPVEREERLNATDLYWHLQQLLHRSPGERSGLLASAPASLQSVLAQRLALWDRLPPAEQEALLQHERTVRYMARLRQVQMPPLPVETSSPARQASGVFETQVASLGKLPPAEFERLHERWRGFFEVPAPRTERALKSMSDSERVEMRAILERFRKLSPEQRRTCVDSFTRLATLSSHDRALFLRSAERWESLPPEERATWRRLVNRLPIFPPLPTDGAAPPMPPTTPPRAFLTNSGEK